MADSEDEKQVNAVPERRRKPQSKNTMNLLRVDDLAHKVASLHKSLQNSTKMEAIK